MLASAALWAAPACAQSEPFTLAQLTQLLAQVKTGEATFTEKRAVAVLERTLESTGRLTFAAPDTFVRETLKPRQEKLAVVGNTVTMSQGARSRTLALDAVPEAAVIVEAVRGTLTGNREALERHFSARVSGAAPRWSLELTPLDARLRAQVASVRVTGMRGVVREVTVALADGDRSVMTIEPVPGSVRTIEPVPVSARTIEPVPAAARTIEPAPVSARTTEPVPAPAPPTSAARPASAAN